MNVPTHINIRSELVPSLKDVRIIHYHGGLDEQGFLRECRYPAVNRSLDRFNRRRSELLGIAYERLPPRTLASALRQGLTSRSWFHAEPAERLKGLRRRLPGLRAWPHVGTRGKP
jgi:hypothetical protein